MTRLQDLAVTTTVTAAETAPDPARTSELRRQAFDAANDGDLVRAADLLEELGDFAQAALLLRQAALQAEGT